MMRIAPVLTLLLLAACADGTAGLFGAKPKAPEAILPPGALPQALDPSMTAPPPAPGARTADALDTTTDEQKAAALEAAPVAAERDLGRVAVSLGTATDPGFWLRTRLVGVPTPGRVLTAEGQTLKVDLLPGEGAAQLSLAAFRALGLNLTGLPEVTVFAE